MIERLFIKNYLIIKEAEIVFSDGLNILTGETGAGKSIIIDALSLILGERADYSIIKNENEKLLVEGIFNFSQQQKNNRRSNEIINFLKSKDIPTYNDNENIFIIRRELYKKGISRVFINDYPVSISDLKEFGKLIIDIHSQNEHQLLLDRNTHIFQLDEYIKQEDGEYDKLFSEYKALYQNYKNLVDELKDLISKRSEYYERKEFLEFQLREINNLNPQENEDEILESELNKLENIEEITLSLNNCINILSGEQFSILDGIHLITKEIKKIIKYDLKFEEVIKDFETVYTYCKELNNTLSNYISNIQFDEKRIEEIRERLGQLTFLKKKYRLSINELIEKSQKLKEELNFASNFDFEIEEREKKIQVIKEKLVDLAIEISEKRKRYAKKLEKNVKKYFNEVGLENAEFMIKFDFYKESSDEYLNTEKTTLDGKPVKVYISEIGIDDVEYFVNMNVSYNNKSNKNNNLDSIYNAFSPLKKVVSGGEISRIMLSIKAVLANKDKIPILVFDEIDAGVSGRIAEKVGLLLKKLSQSHQIISITHLPQIAVFGDTNLNVSKNSIKIYGGTETITVIKKLNEKEKVEEIAKLLSGEKVSDISIKAAEELLKNSKNKQII